MFKKLWHFVKRLRPRTTKRWGRDVTAQAVKKGMAFQMLGLDPVPKKQTSKNPSNFKDFYKALTSEQRKRGLLEAIPMLPQQPSSQYEGKLISNKNLPKN